MQRIYQQRFRSVKNIQNILIQRRGSTESFLPYEYLNLKIKQFKIINLYSQSHSYIQTSVSILIDTPSPKVPSITIRNPPTIAKTANKPNPTPGKSHPRRLKAIPQNPPAKKPKGKSRLIRLIQSIVSKTYPPNNPPLFIFENTTEAATKNSKILQAFDYDMDQVLKASENTILHPGTEFRPIQDLRPLISHHIDWKKFESICTMGAKYSLKPDLDYSAETKRKDLLGAIEQGNNKSAQHPDVEATIDKNYNNEVKKGWMIPFLASIILFIKGASLIPIGCASQWTIDKNGKKIAKKRTTHDFSREWQSGNSINNMIDEDLMDPCLFGFCLFRFLHCIHMMRLTHPHISIFISKIDLDAAFRRIHVWIHHALLAFTIIRDKAYFLSRLPFGASDAPGRHDVASNICVDLANEIMNDETWDPAELQSTMAEKIPEIKREDSSIPFGAANNLAVDVPFRMCAAEGYVDDLITAVLDFFQPRERARHAVPLALDVMYRPKNPDDPIERDEILSLRKLLAEGGLEERKIVLGWLIDTRKFRIYIPDDKATRWIMDLRDIERKLINGELVKTKEWESIAGKCNTASYILREGRFFLNRIRYQIHLSKSRGQYGKSKGNQGVLLDIQLWIRFVMRLRDHGRSINHTTITLPHLFTKQDASTKGLGGFTCFGLAWRYVIPPPLINLIHINVLEFMAVVITTWLCIIALEITDGDGKKLLAQTDNTSALGWLKGSANFNKATPITCTLREIIARKLADLLLKASLSVHSQHIAGDLNDVADQLSRDPTFTNSECQQAIKDDGWTHQQPSDDDLRIVELPDEIISWIHSVLLKAIRMKASPKGEQTKLVAALENGQSSQPSATWTLSSEIQTRGKKLMQSVASRSASDITSLAKRMSMNLEDPQFKPKSTTYVRPSGRMDMTTLSEIVQDE